MGVQHLVVGSCVLIAGVDIHPGVSLRSGRALRLPPLVALAVAELLGPVDPTLVAPLGNLLDPPLAPVASVELAVGPAMASAAIPHQVR
eukprot:12418593-Alexandrium_andersonii.AAC.1